MADHLRESSNQAAALTQASLPYIQQGADFMGGVQRGQQIAGEAQRQQFAARQMMLQESQHEAEMQDLSLKAQLYQGELALRREQAATQMAEAQAQVARAQSQIQLDQIQGRRQGAETRQALSTLPPRKNRDGSYSIADIGDGGQTTWTKVDESDPYVQRYLAEIGKTAAEADAARQRGEYYRSESDWNARRPVTGSSGGKQFMVSGATLQKQISAVDEQLNSLKGYGMLNGQEYKGAELEDKVNELTQYRDFLRNAFDAGVERAASGKEPSGSNGTVKAPATKGGNAPPPPQSPSGEVIGSNAGLALGYASLPLSELGISQDEVVKGLDALILAARAPNSPISLQSRSAEAIVVSMLHDLNSPDEQTRQNTVEVLKRRAAGQ